MSGFWSTRQRRMFEAQFEPRGEGYLYRNHTIGEPIPVSAAQRDHYIAEFTKFTKRGFWAMLGSAIGLLIAFILYSTITKAEVPDLMMCGAFGVMFAAYMAAHLHAWNLPVRELRGR